MKSSERPLEKVREKGLGIKRFQEEHGTPTHKGLRYLGRGAFWRVPSLSDRGRKKRRRETGVGETLDKTRSNHVVVWLLKSKEHSRQEPDGESIVTRRFRENVLGATKKRGRGEGKQRRAALGTRMEEICEISLQASQTTILSERDFSWGDLGGGF